MTQKLIILPLVFGLLGTPSVFAHGTGLADETTNISDGTTGIVSADLGEADPGVLPTNPFYFLKEFSRGLKLFFLFDPIAKLEYESEIANEKAIELKKVIELNPNNDKAIEKALTNYNNNVSRLRTHLESLRLNSNNPNTQKLLDQLSERALRHQRLFEELKEKQTDLQDKFEAAKNRLLDEVVGTLKEKVGVSEKESNKQAKEVVTPSSQAPKTKEVIITDSGFSPKEIKIKKGDSVVWINRGSSPSWLASAIHPTHSIYPEKGGCIGSTFDACRGLGKGESFKFTFNFVGSWKYHDHLNPSLNGVVVVAEK